MPCQTAGGLKGSSACKVEGCGTHGVGAVINGAPLGAAILFSSIAALKGSIGQGTYVAANAGLDLLGQAWQAAGSVCTSVQWGVWGGVGMATRGAASSRFNRMGVDVGTMYPAVGLWALERVAQRVVRLESAVVCVTRSAYWKALSSTVSRPSDVPEFYAEVVEGLQAEGAPALDSLPRLAGKPPAAVMTAGGRGVAAEQRGVSHAAVAQQLLLIVESLVGATVSPEAPLMEEGLDSLGAVELRNSVDRELGVLLGPTAVMDYPSVAALAGHLVEQLGGDQDGDLGRAGAPLEPERPSSGLGRAGGAERPSVVVVGAAAYLPCPGASSSADVVGAGVSSYREAPHQDAVESIPWGRWDAELVEKVLMASGSGNHSVSVRAAAMLPGVGLFDGAVFGVSQAEGMLMDPQQRLALQAGWECLQSSGGSVQSSLHTACGVYVGVQHMEYGQLISQHQLAMGAWMATGGELSVVAGRLSYTFGMQGEALSVDTACSASLVAMRLGWQESLASGGSRSMVAGVNLTLLGGGSAIALAAGMLGGDGRCKTLDASADGYGRGEACQSVVVEGAGQALAPPAPQERQTPPTMGGPLAGAPLAVAGIASNQDGRSSSLTAPNGPSQQAVIGAALEAAVAEPKSVVEMQMHGTGTALGDPIEVGALRSAVLVHREGARKGHGQGRPAPGGPVALSAVKSMVGHAEAAAGLSGVIQLALGMALRAASCIQHVRHVNPLVSGILADAGKGPGAAPAGGPATRGVHVARAASSASTSPDSGGSLREAAVSGVSAFAFQGTNAHAVLRRASAGADVPSARAGLSAGRQGARVWRPVSYTHLTLPTNREV